MQANQPIHLRILVDHSCVEVYTGTGEVSPAGWDHLLCAQRVRQPLRV